MKTEKTNYKKRAKLTEEFIESEFWIQYLKPTLMTLADKYDSLKNIPNDKSDIQVAKQVAINKAKRDIYKGIELRFAEWIKKENFSGKDD